MNDICKAALPMVVALLFFAGCSLPTGGAGGETTNGLISGSISSGAGVKETAVQVRLFSSEYNPVKKGSLVYCDTTDSLGNYVFSSVAPGNYTIKASSSDNETGALVIGIHVAEDTVTAPVCTLGVMGAIGVSLSPESKGAAGYIYIPGTDLFTILTDTNDYAQLDNVPPFTMPEVCYASTTDTGSVVIRHDVTIRPGTTTIIYNPLWSYAQQLILNTTSSGADIAGNILDFPILIRLSPTNFDFSLAAGDGADIRFTKTDGTPLFYEIETWDSTKAAASVWVSVDTIFGSNDSQCIMMYWGAPGGEKTSRSDGTLVFDTANGFQGVWHFTPSGGSAVVDATVNGYHGTPRGSTLPGSTTGIIGSANVFNGTGFIEMPGTAGSTLNYPEHGSYSISAWVNIDSLTDDYQMIASKGDKQYNLQYKGTTESWQFTEYQDTTGWDETASGALPATWVHLVGVRSGVNQYLYVNGTCADSSIFNLAFSPSDTTYAEKKGYRNTTCNFMIGKKVDYADWFFKGAIDEVRVEDATRSRDWIKLCYMNQKSPDALVVFKEK